jgi:hypothetical protein
MSVFGRHAPVRGSRLLCPPGSRQEAVSRAASPSRRPERPQRRDEQSFMSRVAPECQLALLVSTACSGWEATAGRGQGAPSPAGTGVGVGELAAPPPPASLVGGRGVGDGEQGRRQVQAERLGGLQRELG